MGGIAVLIVCGSNAASWRHCDTEILPNTLVRFERFHAAVADRPLVKLSGQSAWRPSDGPPAMSVARSGLSQTSDVTLFEKNEPSYPARTVPRALLHWTCPVMSVVRWSSGPGNSMALLKPNVAPHGCSPDF